MNRQGKTRLAKWYMPFDDEEKLKLKGEVHRLVAPRDQNTNQTLLSFVATKWYTVDMLVYSSAFASMPTTMSWPIRSDPFLCRVFNFYKVYAILDEIFLAGEIQETSKNVVLMRLDHLDKLE
ncbi:hypothetical protein BDF19DRAFT_416937 [Syncephalis fuscata]|nr:hypothetical protein BDF19DRAFT_416937 [Syncephalis fuscata]